MARWAGIDARGGALRSVRRNRPGPWIAGLLAFLSFASAADADAAAVSTPLSFARHSQPVARLTLEELLLRVPAGTVRVHEPYEQGEARFRALSFARVLDAVYGSSWRDEEELLFTCRDGYQPTVPVARVRDHRPWLAFERVDAPGFTIRKRESGVVKRIELGPFYLVWENLDDEPIRQEADYGWPYQLVGVDLIRTRDRFPAMTPPDGAPAPVQAGFSAFRIHCSKCHKLNGEGGSIGPELVAGASPVEYRERDWLRAWIEDPSRIAPGARMPALNPALPERARTVDEILAYLEFMTRARGGARGP